MAISFETPPPEQQEPLLRLNPYLRHAGRRVQEAWSTPTRFQIDYSLRYVLSGQGWFEIEGKRHQIEPGSFWWIPPDKAHAFGSDHLQENLFLHFDLLYDPQRCPFSSVIPEPLTHQTDWRVHLHPNPNLFPFDQWCGQLNITDQGPAMLAIKKTVDLYLRHADPLAIKISLMEILRELERATHRQDQHPLTHRLQEIARQIDDHPQSALDLEKHAKALGIGSAHFSRLFKTCTGLRPRAFQLRAIIDRAKEFLQTRPDLNISQISGELGFDTIHNFSRAFKKATGLSPMEFRRRLD